MWLVGMGTFPLERKMRRQRLNFQGLTMTMECFVRKRYKEKWPPVDSIAATLAAPRRPAEDGKGSRRMENELERASATVYE